MTLKLTETWIKFKQNNDNCQKSEETANSQYLTRQVLKLGILLFSHRYRKNTSSLGHHSGELHIPNSGGLRK